MKFKTNKLLGLFLSFAIVAGVCFCAITSIAASKEITYYVKAKGSDSATGLTVSESLLTVSQALKNAIDGGFTSGDTVYVNVVDYDAVDWGTARNYDFKLVIRADNNAIRNTVVVPNNFTFGGDTAFESIIVKNITDIYYGDKNVSFDKNCTFVSSNHHLGYSSASLGQTVTTSQTVSVKSTVVSKNFRLSNKNASSKTYKEDVNIIFENASSTPSVYLTSETGSTVFEKDLSINIMNAKSADILVNGGSVAVNGALQLIVNSATKVSDESVITLKNVNAKGGFYYIVNASGVDDLINTTETAGEYTVNTDRYQVIATDDNGREFVAEDGILTLSEAGRYVVRTVKIIETATYYVSASGSDENDGKTSGTSVATVARAVELANAAGYLEGDLITIKVARKSILDSTGGSMGTLPRYYFDLVVESATSQRAKITIAGGALIANNQGSTTHYKNIEFNNNSTQWSYVNLSCSNVVFDSDVKFTFGFGTGINYGTGNDGGSGKTIAGQKVEFNCATPYSISITNGVWSGRTYTEDVNLTINSSTANPFIYFNSYHAGSRSGNTRYKKNVNLNFKSMSGVRLSQFDGAIFEGAIQIINSAGIDFDKVYTYAGASSTPPTINEVLANVEADKYLIYNNTGNADIITFTETAGKFAVDTGKYKLTAVDSESNTYNSKDGYIVFEKPGIYTIDVLGHTHTYSSDCDESCDSCGDIRTNAHVYTNICDADCDVCGYVRSNNHLYDHGCDKTCNVCFAIRTTSHIYKGDCDTECDVCFEVRTATEHTYTNSCDTLCNGCGYERIISHTYSNDCDAICNICGYQRDPYDHVYYNSCDTSCNVCRAVRTVEHIFDSVCDKYCNNCGMSRKTAHKYDSDCDANCNICGFKRVAKHIYDGVCDAECNVCSAQRKAHIYDNNCDEICNICSESRTVDDHIFDSDCDIDCAECGYVREATHSLLQKYIANETNHWKQCKICGYKILNNEHKFDDECDKKCDTCGYIRSVDGHEFDSDCDTTCNTCSYERAVAHSYSGVCDESCDLCGAIREGAGHFGGTATCKAKAVCEICGEEYGEKNNNHIGEIKYRGKIAVKCNTHGYTGDGYCLACNKMAIAGSVIPATGLHKYSNECDASCNVCKETREITHQYSPATCTVAQKCLICSTIGSKALGHSYTTKYENATFTSNGRSWEECDGCGLVRNEKVLTKWATVELASEKFIYDGNQKLPIVTVKDADGTTLSTNNYDLICDTAINVGAYLVTVNFKNGYSGRYTLSFDILPPATSLNQLSTSLNTVTVSYFEQTQGITGYQVEYSTSSDFADSKVKTISNKNTTTAEIKALKFNTVYYVRIRTYTNVDGVKFYSEWGLSQQIKTE